MPLNFFNLNDIIIKEINFENEFAQNYFVCFNLILKVEFLGLVNIILINFRKNMIEENELMENLKFCEEFEFLLFNFSFSFDYFTNTFFANFFSFLNM